MLTIRRQKIFSKDLLKVKMSNQHYSKYILFLSTLLQELSLPIEAKDHPLSGEYQDTREFHISGDLLVIYFTTQTELVLIRIGSHSQLFN
ncbi:type II toxin-antitoxin system YafQ family toxin [Sulfurimonas sp. SAG-AH-194-C21]|nr:type II toxin-antitoxin system YafQ family toxin [Sulfurimonas sp. SAG-AH-194-C21]MDF1884568.1 type II toxin-antitoxin system YafQ family toxin [Sulfurimonas sp. SAG-AH-194-C21]